MTAPSDTTTPALVTDGEQSYADHRREQYERDIALEQERKQRVLDAAAELLDASRQLGWGSGIPLIDSVRWLTEAAATMGYATPLMSEDLLDDLRPRKSGGAGWPDTRHLRVHWLADRDGGWTCQECGIGLVDVCSNIDMIVVPGVGRSISPDCGKRLPTVDHIVPRSLGGSDQPDNLRLVCQSCNSRKGAR